MSDFETGQHVRVVDTSFYDSLGSPGDPAFLVPGATGTVTAVNGLLVTVAIDGDPEAGFPWAFETNEIEKIDA